MQLGYDNPEVMVGGNREQSQFKFAANGHAFKIMSDSLYSDKIRAIVRELCTNAWDGHVAAGKENEPFDIHFPTILDPYFYVRDYGIGLSHQDVMDVYTTFFESTKNSSNKYVGALGLGSKSPFAYTDQFVIESWHGGEHNTYSAYIGEGGTPQCSHLSTKPCSEDETGVKVSLPAENRDCKFDSVFIEKARMVLPCFDVLPNLLNLDETTANTIKSEHQIIWDQMPSIGETKMVNFDGRTPSAFKNNQWFVRQGNVVYPVKPEDIKFSALVDDNADDKEIEAIKHRIEWFNDYLEEVCTARRGGRGKLITHVAMGDADIAPSREALNYNDRTTEMVYNIIKKYTVELRQRYREGFKAYGTTYELLEAASELESKMFKYVPQWLKDDVGELPSSAKGTTQWLELSLKPLFPEHAGKDLLDLVFFKDTLAELKYRHLPPEGSVTQKAHDQSHHLRLELARFYTDGRVASANSKNFMNSRQYSRLDAFRNTIRQPSGQVKLILSDKTDKIGTSAQFVKKMNKLDRFNDDGYYPSLVYVLRVDPDDIRKTRDCRNLAGFQDSRSEILEDFKQEDITAAMREMIPLYEWLFNGKVVLQSDIEDELDEEIKAIRSQERKRRLADGCLMVETLPFGAVKDAAERSQTSRVWYYLPTQAGSAVLLDCEHGNDTVSSDNVRHLFKDFSNAFKFDVPVFVLNKTNIKRAKKLGLMDNAINILDFMTSTINKFFEREPSVLNAIRLRGASRAINGQLNNIMNSPFYQHHAEIFTDSKIAKPMVKFNRRVEESVKDIFGMSVDEFHSKNRFERVLLTRSIEPRWFHKAVKRARITQHEARLFKDRRQKIDFFQEHYGSLIHMNRVTGSRDYLPASPKISTLMQDVNSLSQVVDNISAKMVNQYPLLNYVQLMDDTVDHIKIYIEAVDKKNNESSESE